MSALDKLRHVPVKSLALSCWTCEHCPALDHTAGLLRHSICPARAEALAAEADRLRAALRAAERERDELRAKLEAMSFDAHATPGKLADHVGLTDARFAELLEEGAQFRRAVKLAGAAAPKEDR